VSMNGHEAQNGHALLHERIEAPASPITVQRQYTNLRRRVVGKTPEDEFIEELEYKLAIATNALEIIACQRQCVDNMMSNYDVAKEALNMIREV